MPRIASAGVPPLIKVAKKSLCAVQVKDRALVAQRMKAHVAGEDQTPLLIFPEGTCVNNEYCVMFKVRL